MNDAAIRLREAQHRHHFNEFELRTLETVCARFDKPLGAFSRETLTAFVELFHTAHYSVRSVPAMGLLVLKLGFKELSTFRRAEWEHLARDPEFARAAQRLIDGDKNAATMDEQDGLTGMVESLRQMLLRAGRKAGHAQE